MREQVLQAQLQAIHAALVGKGLQAQADNCSVGQPGVSATGGQGPPLKWVGYMSSTGENKEVMWGMMQRLPQCVSAQPYRHLTCCGCRMRYTRMTANMQLHLPARPCVSMFPHHRCLREP